MMDQRIIRELADQIQWSTDTTYTELTKFAELIVKDCISMADEFEMDVNRSGLVDRMKRHFGVE